jgi:hypothetical protein
LTTAVDDLLEFATTQRKATGPPCAVCLLPERAVIDEAKRKAPPRTVGSVMVRRWLIAKHGYTDETVPTKSEFGHHFNQGHHQEAA